MYDRVVAVPRLLCFYGEDAPLPDPVLTAAREALNAHYGPELGEPFRTAGLCLYRDGRDSVAWHGDTIGRGQTEDTMVAIVSLGSPRALLLRPRGGGGRRPLRFEVGHGDLLVMGGSCQRTWEHAVPKTRQGDRAADQRAVPAARGALRRSAVLCGRALRPPFRERAAERIMPMKAIVYEGTRRVGVHEVEDAAIEDPTDVVVRVTSSAICGTDLHMYDGRTGAEPGLVIGHEPLGVIEQAGEDVSLVKPGDRVVIPTHLFCGMCFNCVRGYTAACLRVRPGGFGAAYGYAGLAPTGRPGGAAAGAVRGRELRPGAGFAAG